MTAKKIPYIHNYLPGKIILNSRCQTLVCCGNNTSILVDEILKNDKKTKLSSIFLENDSFFK